MMSVLSVVENKSDKKLGTNNINNPKYRIYNPNLVTAPLNGGTTNIKSMMARMMKSTISAIPIKVDALKFGTKSDSINPVIVPHCSLRGLGFPR